MIRVLVLIAVTGFFVAVVTISSAFAIGGPEVLANTAWSSWHKGHMGPHGGWTWDWDSDDDQASGPQATRTLAWSGGDALEIDVPADVTYTQAAGPAKLTVTGPKQAVDDVVVAGGHIRFADGFRHHRHGSKLTVVMSAPDVSRFAISGSGRLAINDFKQAKLALDLSGDTEVTAKGQADSIDVDISGSAQADLGQIKAKGAEVDISGAGEVIVAPTEWAKLGISGSGEVTLKSNPPKLETDISGSGSIRQEGGEADVVPAPEPAKAGKRL